MEEENNEKKAVELNLRGYIRERGYTFREFAKYLNTSERNFRRIVSRQQNLSNEKAVLLLQKGVPFAVLFPHLSEDTKKLLKFLVESKKGWEV